MKLKDKMKFKISISRSTIVVIMLIITIVGGTFAWFTYRSRESALVLTIGDINNTSITIKPYQIRETMVPVNTYNGGVYSQVKAINNNTENTEISLFYIINDIDELLINNGLKYTVLSSSSLDGVYELVSTGDFTVLGDADRLDIMSEELTSNTTVFYRVYLWLDTNVGDQSLVQNLSLDVELNGAYFDDYT